MIYLANPLYPVEIDAITVVEYHFASVAGIIKNEKKKESDIIDGYIKVKKKDKYHARGHRRTAHKGKPYGCLQKETTIPAERLFGLDPESKETGNKRKTHSPNAR